jgi:mannose-6-phosphate isomerase-like protein (cupin superfamily)
VHVPRIRKVNLAAKLAEFTEQWTPKIVGKVNDVHVKLARIEGEFPWHMHEAEDELFLVIKGSLLLEFRDRELHVEAGEFVIVPRATEHRPVAREEVHLLLIEPATTLNTGNIRTERTVDEPEWL